MIDELISILSNSTALAGADQELLDSIDADLKKLPGLDRRVLELNAQEPYRLKLTCIKAKLINTGKRVAADSMHEHGRDYSATDELLADLELLELSLRNHSASLAADGALARVRRAVASFGLHLATLDIREHADHHHDAVGQLMDRLGGPGLRYAELSREERFEVLGSELASRRPLSGHPIKLDGVADGTYDVFREIRRALRIVRPGRHRDLHHFHDPRRGRRPGRRRPGPRSRPDEPLRRERRTPRSGSRRCWKPWRNCGPRPRSWTSCCPTRPTANWCGCAATSRKSCSATRTPTRNPV